MTPSLDGNQVSYKTNIDWFAVHNDVELMSSPTNKKALPKDVREFLSKHDHDGVEVTLRITRHCECESCLLTKRGNSS